MAKMARQEIEQIKYFADCGNAVAQWEYAMLLAGEQSPDVSQVVAYLEKSAMQGYPPALSSLGCSHESSPATSLTIVSNFEDFCKDVVIPALKEDAAENRWKGVTPSSFITEKSDNWVVVYVDYKTINNLVLRLGLWGVMDKNNIFVINCKCLFIDSNSNQAFNNAEYIQAMIARYYDDFCKIGFGVSKGNDSICVWASLDEENGQYPVEGVEDPYDLFSIFLDIIIT